MNEKLQRIAHQINEGSISGENTFSADFDAELGTVTVENTESPDAVVIVFATDTQILTITPLFDEQSVKEDLRAELNRGLLSVSYLWLSRRWLSKMTAMYCLVRWRSILR
ncbi:MAG: DUF2170 family protein [Gammaproteobacteria bacterium]|nr:DUF2170 family protein [Gammaproteobacteria bacterium]